MARRTQSVKIRATEVELVRRFSQLVGELLMRVENADEALLEDGIRDAARDLRAFVEEHFSCR